MVEQSLLPPTLACTQAVASSELTDLLTLLIWCSHRVGMLPLGISKVLVFPPLLGFLLLS